jgi:predicted Zn-dependent peptidase
MLDYHRFFLDNGLEVIVHEDSSSKIAVFNLLYKVGSRFEKPGKTGLAHFFEHLMFGSSTHVPEVVPAMLLPALTSPITT